MSEQALPEGSKSFSTFYRGAYAADHSHPVNRALHMTGTLAGIGLLATGLAGAIAPWWLLGFPVVHVAPGLVGHRLFDRNLDLGDVRVIGGDYPNLWFMAANHLMTVTVLWRLLTLRDIRSRIG